MNPRLIEITAKVLSFLQPREILNLERTCSISNRTCQDPVIDREIWRNALRDRFGGMIFIIPPKFFTQKSIFVPKLEVKNRKLIFDSFLSEKLVFVPKN